MNTQTFRDELSELGDRTGAPHVAPDLWQRGRRARRRDRLTFVAGACVLLIALGAATTLVTFDPSLSQRTAPSAASGGGSDSGGIPSMVHLPPDHLIDVDENGVHWDPRVAESELAIGRGAVAFAAMSGKHESHQDGSVPMVVTAEGLHHALELPGWAGSDPAGAQLDGSRLLALSPDGRFLAYPQRSEADSGATDELVGVLDLLDGDLRTIKTPESVGPLAATTLVWSPDSRWLVWSGIEPATGRKTGGRVAPDATETQLFDFPANSIGIASDGTVTALHDAQTRQWDGTQVKTVWGPTSDSEPAASTSPDGTSVLLSGEARREQNALFLDPRTGRTTARELGKDLDLYPEGATVQALGWIDDSQAVALVMPLGNVTRPDDFQIVVMSAPSVPEASWTYRIVSRVDVGEARAFSPHSVSVAVDLMSLDRASVDTPAPDWPADMGRRWLMVGLVALIAGVVVLLLLLWRRRPA